MEREPLSATELEMVMSSDIRSGGLRPVGDVFRRVITALNNAKIEYVLAGAMARGLYARARFTEGIDLIAPEESRSHLLQTLFGVGLKCEQELPGQLTFIDPDTRIAIYVLLGTAYCEKFAVGDHLTATIFDTPTSVIKPEYLLWMWCVSDRAQDRADAIAVVNGGKADMTKLNRRLVLSGDRTAQKRLQTLLAQAEKEETSSYGDSVARRLRERDPL